MENKTTMEIFNPLVNNLQTLEVGHNEKDPSKKKSVEKYFSQIKSNLYIGVKAHYLIARDLFDAKVNLKNNDFSRLVEQLSFSGSTQSKYLNIGKDIRLFTLFTKGKLPFKWTSQYFLTTLTDEKFNKVAKQIDADMPISKIKEIADVGKAEAKEFENKLLSMLTVEVDRTKFVNKGTFDFDKLVKKVKSALDSIPEITINDDKVDTVRDKISSFISKAHGQKRDVEKAKQIIANANLLGVA